MVQGGIPAKDLSPRPALEHHWHLTAPQRGGQRHVNRIQVVDAIPSTCSGPHAQTSPGWLLNILELKVLKAEIESGQPFGAASAKLAIDEQ